MLCFCSFNVTVALMVRLGRGSQARVDVPQYLGLELVHPRPLVSLGRRRGAVGPVPHASPAAVGPMLRLREARADEPLGLPGLGRVGIAPSAVAVAVVAALIEVAGSAAPRPAVLGGGGADLVEGRRLRLLCFQVLQMWRSVVDGVRGRGGYYLPTGDPLGTGRGVLFNNDKDGAKKVRLCILLPPCSPSLRPRPPSWSRSSLCLHGRPFCRRRPTFRPGDVVCYRSRAEMWDFLNVVLVER